MQCFFNVFSLYAIQERISSKVKSSKGSCGQDYKLHHGSVKITGKMCVTDGLFPFFYVLRQYYFYCTKPLISTMQPFIIPYPWNTQPLKCIFFFLTDT